MEDNEQLKLTDFTDPLIQLAIGMAIAADILFIIIPIRYIFAVIVAIVLWPGMRGLVTKIIFVLCLVLPLPLMTIGAVLGVLLSNALVRAIAIQLGIIAVGALTAGTGAVAGEAALAAGETAAVGAEVAAGAAATAEAGVAVGAEAAGAAAEAGVGAVGEAAGAIPKPVGPAAQPPKMPGPQAQPEEVKKPSFRERVKEKVIKKGKEELAEKLAEEGGPEKKQKEEGEGEESNVIEGEFGNPDVVNLENESDEGTDEETIDLRKAA